MSVEQYQRELNKLDEEISKLSTKQANIESEISKLEGKIISIKKSINKNTSASVLASKSKQIENLESNKAKKSKERAELSGRIAQKTKKRNDVDGKLQRERKSETKKSEKQQKAIKDSYEKQISNLQTQLKQTLASAHHNSSQMQENDEEYDFFISHAYEDKEEFVDEFVDELKKLNVKVWYDTVSIKWGDSIRAEIDKGLKRSKFGVVVLSRSYVGKYWTNYELEGLFQRESNGGKLILPIWHNITKQEVRQFSPTLAGKMAMNTMFMTPDEIAEQLSKLLCDGDDVN